ncbi:hypothetical protein [Gynuella sunshinyii]|uniref:hypothetical protein n=1 Tax=Gynuella sunshinyii TaxID=1445505 RepID=UPI001B80635B|nr:hypothetical protein [Gynuella sunshinyii]
MSNSKVLLGQIMEAVETEGLLCASEIKSIEKLIPSGKIKEETALPPWKIPISRKEKIMTSNTNLKSLSISGLRGVSNPLTINFDKPFTLIFVHNVVADGGCLSL